MRLYLSRFWFLLSDEHCIQWGNRIKVWKVLRNGLSVETIAEWQNEFGAPASESSRLTCVLEFKVSRSYDQLPRFTNVQYYCMPR